MKEKKNKTVYESGGQIATNLWKTAWDAGDKWQFS